MRSITYIMSALAGVLIAPGALHASIHIQAGDHIRMRDEKADMAECFTPGKRLGRH